MSIVPKNRKKMHGIFSNFLTYLLKESFKGEQEDDPWQ